MHICTYSAQTHATPQAIWAIWTNVKHWSSWDPTVKGVELQGNFKQGVTGTLQATDGSQKEFTVIKVQMLESIVISMPYLHNTELLIKWSMQTQGDEVHFEQEVTLSGNAFAKLLLRNHKEPLLRLAGQQMQGMLNLLEGEAPAATATGRQGNPRTA